MFLFHGTKERHIAAIESEGLVPPRLFDWEEYASRWSRHIEPSIFLSNLPRAGWGSDALGFASYGREDGYMVVVDCDPSYLEERLIGIWDTRDVNIFLGYHEEFIGSRADNFEDFLTRKLSTANSDCQYITSGIGREKIFDIFKVYDARSGHLEPDYNPKFVQKLPWKKKNFANLIWKRVLGKKRRARV